MPIDDIPTCIVYVNSFTLLLKLEVGISAHFSGTVFATPTSVRPSREMSSVINCCTIYEVKKRRINQDCWVRIDRDGGLDRGGG